MNVYPVIERATKAGRMSTFRVVQIRTTARETHVVVRNTKGRKLFEMDIPGVALTLSVPINAKITIEPDPFAAKKGRK